MDLDQLKERALTLPLAPGVYIMRDATNKVIYVGKAKKLKNRVSQYFQDTASHTLKTRSMVMKVDHFDVIVAASEFEALVLECSLIKRHQPKYNILLKDDKGYPYIRLSVKDAYPTMSLVNQIVQDGAEYYGPFGSRGLTNQIIESILTALKLPSCKKIFPRDIGKDRPCLQYHMNQCNGWCQRGVTQDEYLLRIEQVRQLLSGNYKKIAEAIRKEMLVASENLEFELAAELRDRLVSVEALGQKQLVTAGSLADTDVIGFGQTETKACFAVLHFCGGNLLDKEYEVFARPDDPEQAVSELVKQYYLIRGGAPKRVLLPFDIEDVPLFEQFMLERFQKKTRFSVPQRGDNVRLVALANTNAQEETQRLTSSQERYRGAVTLLGKMLSIEPPARIEAYDISNISGTDIVASMVVFEHGQPKKSEYKKFKIRDLDGQDDYASMRQVVTRRFSNYIEGEKGFETAPDLVLIDGGVNHTQEALSALKSLGLHTQVFGMVKDDRHRTRALVTPDGFQINIDAQQAVFSLIGNIQEETHRFAISYHRQLRSKRLRYSQLDDIPGIGQKRKQDLLRQFKSITAIKQATLPELERYLPVNVASSVYAYFHENQKDQE